MKRSRLARKGGLQRRTPLKGRRSTPRRREAPRWDSYEWVEANQKLLMRSNGRCEKCGTRQGIMERHHRKRRRDGGDTLANILFACRECHAWCHAHPGEARKFGWIVSVTAAPDATPVLLWDKTWVQFDDDGGVSELFNHVG